MTAIFLPRPSLIPPPPIWKRLAAGAVWSDARIIARILAFEGSEYTHHPADYGGPTKYGITLRALADWLNRPVSAEDLQRLSREEAVAFYGAVHLRPFDRLPDPLRGQSIDLGVHRGVRTAIMALQGIAGTDVDGVLGLRSVRAVEALGLVRTNNLLVGARLQHFESLIRKDPAQARWRPGWRNRALSFYVQDAASEEAA